MAHLWRMGITGLLACTLVLGGCGDGGESAQERSGDLSGAPSGQLHASERGAGSESVPSFNALAPAESLGAGRKPSAATEPPVRAVVLPSGESAALPPAEDFRARVVEVTLGQGAGALSLPELAAARAQAFGLDWGPRNHKEIHTGLNRKNRVRGCAQSYGNTSIPIDDGRAIFSQTDSGHLDPDNVSPYSVRLEFLGSREGRDHYLLELNVEEVTVVATPDMAATPSVSVDSAVDSAASAAVVAPVASAPVVASVASAAVSASAIPVSASVVEPLLVGERVHIHTVHHLDGRVETTHTRARTVAYELVYSGELFHLKLADRMLFSFGPQVEEERTAEYRPCPLCALSDEMQVDELRPAVAVAAAVRP